MIKLSNINLNIKNKKILKDINLEINYSDISVIIGHNGAGKTSLLKILSKLIVPSSGLITYNSEEFCQQSSFVFQKPIFFNQTVLENLKFSLLCKKIKDTSIINSYLSEFNLLHLSNIQANKLSSGEQQLISFIRSLITNPKTLFLDEPTSNLDSYYKTLIENHILKISDYTKIIIISQNKRQIKLFSNNPISLHQGRIL